MIEILDKIPFKLARWELLASVASSLVLREIGRTATAQPIGPLCEKPQYGVSQAAYREPVGPRFVRITDIQNGSVDWNCVPHCQSDKPEKYELKPGDILIGRTGSVGKTLLVKQVPELAVFASYLIRLRPREALAPTYLYWCLQSLQFWGQILAQSRGSAIKNINSEMLKALRFPVPDRLIQAKVVTFLDGVETLAKGEVNTPPKLDEFPEQGRVIARIASLASRIDEIKALRNAMQTDNQALLLGAFHRVTEGARYRPMAKVAPIVRRKVEVEPDGDYPELGVRSFGKGPFQKPTISGMEVGSKRLYRICPRDLVLSNVFAWEGAIAVARSEDKGRFGSHRFITCVADPEIATPEFLCFYLLTEEGMQQVQEASPGGAGRNRTLGLKKLEKIDVPIPHLDEQLWFNHLHQQVTAMRDAQANNQTELEALLPAILDQAFKGNCETAPNKASHRLSS